ncbi:MAG: hypothetical protein EA402_00955 [Planctomycetota bacterium]|nr:MAG: hypothetical protein EA402_00955 [Planctomycetota bacterium]
MTDQASLRDLEERVNELQAAIPEGYSLRFVTLDQIRLDRPYDKEPIPESWVETTAHSIADEGLKHPIRLDQSLRVLAGQVRSTALRLLRDILPERFRERFPTGQIPVFIHDLLHWDRDPEGCERELLLLQRGREMPSIKEREAFVLADAYRSLSDPKALWTSGGPTPLGRYRPIGGLAQRWFMSERHVRNVVKPLRPYIEERIGLGEDDAAIRALAGHLPPLERLVRSQEPNSGGSASAPPRTLSRGWKHYLYHAHKSAASLNDNLQSVDSPLATIAGYLAQRLDEYRRASTQPPNRLDPATAAELHRLIDSAQEDQGAVSPSSNNGPL